MSDSKDEMRAAAMLEAECATGGGDTVSRALHRRELSEKDATIKALADALDVMTGQAALFNRDTDPVWVSCATQARAALRLAGRLP